MLTLIGLPIFLAGVALASDSEFFFGSPAKQNVVEDVEIQPTKNLRFILILVVSREACGAVDR